MSTESELVKEAFSDPCFLKQVRGLEAMLRVRARSSPGSNAIAAAGANSGTTGLLEGKETKLRDGFRDSSESNNRDLDGMEDACSALGVRRDFGGARTVLVGSSLAFPSGLGGVSGAGVALCAATVSASSAGETDSERHALVFHLLLCLLLLHTRRLREVWSHLPSTRRFLVSNSCHLDTDWTSGNQWAGRSCVVPHNRGFGCFRVTPELVCFLRILITFGEEGFLGEHTRPPGLRQGTTVCVHTSMDMEQQSDHKLITPSGLGLLVCGAGSHPS